MTEIKYQLIDITNWIKYEPLTIQEMSYGQWEIEWRYYKEWEYDKIWDVATLPRKDYCYMQEEWTEFVWRQHTWLKDKNWKEIYEGDIVKTTTNYYWNKKENIEEIKWEEDIENDSFWEPLTLWYCIRWYDLEIIWNIYENPELLTKK